MACHTCNAGKVHLVGPRAIRVEDGLMPELHEQLDSFLVHHKLFLFRKFDIATATNQVQQQHVEHYSTNSEVTG